MRDEKENLPEEEEIYSPDEWALADCRSTPHALSLELEKLTAEYLARGGKITQCGEGESAITSPTEWYRAYEDRDVARSSGLTHHDQRANERRKAAKARRGAE